ncbi:MAG: HAMP domain-containing sensor histidine kinase [Ferruginibacter sp.]
MNKSGTSRVLMTATIILIIAFQVYWLNKLYHEEESNFKKSVDIVFREAMYRLQAERFKNDTMIFRQMQGDNLFMTDLVSTVQRTVRKNGDSSERKIMITLQTGDRVMNGPILDTFKKNELLYVNAKEGDTPPPLPPHIAKFFEKNPTLNDTIPLKTIDSLYSALLTKEGIRVPFNISRSQTSANTIITKSFATKKVPVGFFKPVYYQAVFNESALYVLKKIYMQLILSLLLIVLTTLSFIFIYKSLLAQKRLTQIKNEFINNITHELKTPIATVNVAIEALRNFGGLQNPERTKEYLDISALELQRLSLLVDKVLKLSMFESREIALQKESFSILELVQEVMVSMKLQLDKQNTTSALEASGKNFIIEADKLHIASVIYNLLDNALKYSKENSHVIVHVLDQANYLELRVTDNGMGIPEEYKRKIFEQFFRVPNGDVHNIKGYGLGLSYVNHIVQRHMGFIEVETTPGKGSTFIIKIPFAEAPVIHYDRNRRIIKKVIRLKRS